MGRMQCAANFRECAVAWLVGYDRLKSVVLVVSVVFVASASFEWRLLRSVLHLRDLVVECGCLVCLGMASKDYALVVCSRISLIYAVRPRVSGIVVERVLDSGIDP